MNYSIGFIEEAKLDFKDIFQWYESKIIGLGNKFIDSVNTSVKKIKTNLYQYQLQYGEPSKGSAKVFYISNDLYY